ncbi:methylenetetrahydrofolate reductase [NAD(P)H] [candidate division WOR-1 bacterium RIFCSPHIGHO2_01_FULL_53_15]|uniref:Methylenetetrahydrofolate reductase n=1 Tax=candidate division WOR-1 bacterium RIFCSPHIGHO2_01_FULL_53_15 TaxID=1802564 RepID=A0A1F4Q2K0_UNCSA|nr:MAG: methylenetetrahydrofolate reductase [NAD(P)H] [candidate division WOR-1 bacterium RIFCSPHIGHO2_01_FULL_53_15]OGC13715.1 MAG: methylenetetrahydrofolate reductase [NAD(P)H] [candidate division WOR-1 bacterium RIFCSPHIGHO2_02_FULL_53_26]
MKVTEAFKKAAPALSFEFFPPKTPEQEEHLFDVIGKLKAFKPDFVSVTYGAMGTTREKTFHWVETIKNKFKIEPVAHLTCVAASKKDIAGQLDQLDKIGIENILALRGDPPEGTTEFVPPADGFKFARDLIRLIKEKKPGFCLGAAAFPENTASLAYLKEKIEAGAEYAITQLFFDNRYYFEYVEKARKAGLSIPIVPGLMTITNLKQIKRLTKVCGATIPEPLLKKLEALDGDTEAIHKLGAEHTLAQARELIKAGAPGLHFFVMNQAEPIAQILKQLAR